MFIDFHDADCIMPDEYFEDYEDDLPDYDECEDESAIEDYFDSRD